MPARNFVKLVIAIIISELAGVTGALFTTPAIQSGWYATLAKPALSPPGWVFGPVWVTLYALMGVAAWMIWRRLDSRAGGNDKGEDGNDKKVKIALGVFGAQLFLNALWSIIFFGLRSPGAALIEIIFLWIAILATIIAFARISKPAAWLLAPYILWVSFAAYLNYAIRTLN